MKFFTPLVLAMAALTTAMPAAENPAVPAIAARQNQNRPVPRGTCCVANTSLKQDSCFAANGQPGRCVPGGNNCGSRLSCVANSQLTCTNNIIERGKNLCRARAGNGRLFDGARLINNLNQATVN
ncbi:Putative protein of unknown function [Podospora comata]|uniref:Uncharacterized protein n=1 Tax=Podospora comata TaxID=48703 RepID=A0ABY6S5G1_PODCO|nr:Putative protein of unknown function [Podospora comata]